MNSLLAFPISNRFLIGYLVLIQSISSSITGKSMSIFRPEFPLRLVLYSTFHQESIDDWLNLSLFSEIQKGHFFRDLSLSDVWLNFSLLVCLLIYRIWLWLLPTSQSTIEPIKSLSSIFLVLSFWFLTLDWHSTANDSFISYNNAAAIKLLLCSKMNSVRINRIWANCYRL